MNKMLQELYSERFQKRQILERYRSEIRTVEKLELTSKSVKVALLMDLQNGKKATISEVNEIEEKIQILQLEELKSKNTKELLSMYRRTRLCEDVYPRRLIKLVLNEREHVPSSKENKDNIKKRIKSGGNRRNRQTRRR